MNDGEQTLAHHFSDCLDTNHSLAYWDGAGRGVVPAGGACAHAFNSRSNSAIGIPWTRAAQRSRMMRAIIPKKPRRMSGQPCRQNTS